MTSDPASLPAVLWSILRSLASTLAPASMLALATMTSLRTAWIVYGVVIAAGVVIAIAYEIGRNLA